MTVYFTRNIRKNDQIIFIFDSEKMQNNWPITILEEEEDH